MFTTGHRSAVMDGTGFIDEERTGKSQPEIGVRMVGQGKSSRPFGFQSPAERRHADIDLVFACRFHPRQGIGEQVSLRR